MRENLRNARKDKKMTQQAVADYLGENNIHFKMRYNSSLIVCENGSIYKKRKDGLHQLLPAKITPSSRYVYVNVEQDGKTRHLLAHRVIAETFLENKCNLPVVNHIDGNTENNSVENLEWCSQKDNIQHMVNMHKQKYLTNLKKKRLDSRVTTNKIARKIGLLLGRYKDIENAVRPPNEEEKSKLEEYFGDSIENLLMKAEEETI